MRKRAFTLIEMLVVLAVTAVVLAISVPAWLSCIKGGQKAMEIASGRKIIAGYLLYAADHDGQLMAGYKSEDAVDASGNSLEFPANARYPWRLAPYIDFDMHAILFNGNEKALQDKVDFHYAASVSPNLGMNVTFVGGDYGSGSDMMPSDRATSTYGVFCVTRLSQASKPSDLIVFASARRGTDEVGFYQVKSPCFVTKRWGGKWNPDAPASVYGFIDMRYSRHAVTAMLDGHVELLDEDEIQDMRRWSNQAAEKNDPYFTLQKIQ